LLMLYSKGANGKCNSLFKFVVDFMKERAGQSSTIAPENVDSGPAS